MGLFSGFIGHVNDLNKVSIAVGNVIVLLDIYDNTRDSSILPVVAWICKKGILDNMTSGHILPTFNINFTVNYQMQRMKVHEALTRSIGRFSMIIGELSETDKNCLLDILDGGEEYTKIDSKISDDQKRMYLKQNVTRK